jgi:hypothetical protein
MFVFFAQKHGTQGLSRHTHTHSTYFATPVPIAAATASSAMQRS